jgi:hypothetical protein
MSSFEKNRPSTTIIDHEIAETINNDERTAVHTPEFDTDLEKQKQKSEAQETPAATTPTTAISPTVVVIEIPDGGVVAWGTVFGAYVCLSLFSLRPSLLAEVEPSISPGDGFSPNLAAFPLISMLTLYQKKQMVHSIRYIRNDTSIWSLSRLLRSILPNQIYTL